MGGVRRSLLLLGLSVLPCMSGCAGFFQNAAVTVTLTPSAASAAFGTTITLSSTVAAKDPASQTTSGVPTGSVEYYDGSTDLGGGTLSSGAASLTTSTLAVGKHLIYATYEGDANYNSTTSASQGVTISGVLTETTTTLTSSATSVTAGTAVSLVASVSNASATGTVNFYSGTTLVGSAALTAGVATLVTSALPTGADAVTATYVGDTMYATSTSSAVTVTVH